MSRKKRTRISSDSPERPSGVGVVTVNTGGLLTADLLEHFITRLEKEGPDIVLSALTRLHDLSDFKAYLASEITGMDSHTITSADPHLEEFTKTLRAIVKTKPTLLLRLVGVIRQSKISKEDMAKVAAVLKTSKPDAGEATATALGTDLKSVAFADVLSVFSNNR